MSAINTDLLQNRLGTSHPAVTKADFVKAYCLVTHVGTVTATNALNIASVADTGVGTATVNFTTPFSGFAPVGASAPASTTGVALNSTGSYVFVTNFVCSTGVGIDSYSQIHFCGALA